MKIQNQAGIMLLRKTQSGLELREQRENGLIENTLSEKFTWAKKHANMFSICLETPLFEPQNAHKYHTYLQNNIFLK